MISEDKVIEDIIGEPDELKGDHMSVTFWLSLAMVVVVTVLCIVIV